LTPGLYWVGGAVQVVSVTQPTARVLSAAQGYLNLPLGTSAPSANQTMLGFSATGATAALPGSFNATVTTSSLTPRVFVKVA
jgi:hypothetical protein